MKSGDDRGFADLIAVRSGRWLHSLRGMAAAILLMALPLCAGPARAATPDPASTHVYLLRGVLNIFSLGLDEIAAKLRRQGYNVTITNYLYWSSLADEAAAEYRSGRTKTIVLVGHSSGATALPDMVARLDRLGAPVKLAIGLDSVFRTSLAGHVGRYINFYVANGNGEPVTRDQAVPRRAREHRRGQARDGASHDRQERAHAAQGDRRHRCGDFRPAGTRRGPTRGSERPGDEQMISRRS